MAVVTTNFTTGPSTLPDVGTLFYNGCTFSPLFMSKLSGTAIKDAANRTVKLMEYALEVDGYVTLAAGNTNIAPTMANLELILTAQAGQLTYVGRGFDFTVNGGKATFDNASRDVAWGPVPELLEFQPLGNGLSAKVVWRVTFRVVTGQFSKSNAKLQSPLLEFNCDTVVTYNEDYFSSLSVNGTMEIPLTRDAQGIRTLKTTVDDMRSQLDTRIFSGIDLSRFRVVRREYPISRDKRTMHFSVQVDEKSYMDLPPDCTIADGTFSFRPATSGMGLVNWFCTLQATYTVAPGRPRRVAYLAFLALLRERMRASQPFDPTNRPEAPVSDWTAPSYTSPVPFWNAFLAAQEKVIPKGPLTSAFIMSLSGEEGLYRNSKTTSFSATWRLVTGLNNILIASGMWEKVPEKDAQGNNLWATSMRNISGSTSWIPNRLDPAADIIVDFGGG